MSQSAGLAIPLVNGHGHTSVPGISKGQASEKLFQYRNGARSGSKPQPSLAPLTLKDAARLLSSRTPLPRVSAALTTAPENTNAVSQPTTPARAHFSSAVPARSHGKAAVPTPAFPTKSNLDNPFTKEDRSKSQQFRRPDKDKSEEEKEPEGYGERLLPYIDIGSMLEQALQKVPHVSAFNPTATATNGSNDSFDENSLYSSAGWSPIGANDEIAPAEQSNGSDVMDISDDGEIYEPEAHIGPNVADASNSDQASYEEEDAENDYEPSVPDIAPNAEQEADMLEYADDEDDNYSPPPPDEREEIARNTSGQVNAFRGFEPPPMADAYYTRRGRPFYQKRANEQAHTAPPGPAKRRSQGFQKRNGQADTRSNLQGARRRRAADREPVRRASGKRRARSGSPDVFIKPEPVSPPPLSFNGTPPSRNHCGPSADDAETDSPHMVRRRSGYQSGYESAYDDNGNGFNGNEGMGLRSPASIRRSQRDDLDLRRVASVQYAARPRSREPAMRPLHTSWARLGETIVDGKVVPVIQTGPERAESPPKVLFVDQNGKAYYNKPPRKGAAPLIVKTSRKSAHLSTDSQYYDAALEPVTRNSMESYGGNMDVANHYPRAATQQPSSYGHPRPHGEIDDYERMPPPPFRPSAAYLDISTRPEHRQRAFSMHPLQAAPTEDVNMLETSSQQYDPARPATSLRDAPYAQRTISEYIPRTHSVRPEATMQQEVAPYQNVVSTPSQAMAPTFAQNGHVPRTYSVHPGMSAARGVAPVHMHQPSGYGQATINEVTYPPRAYSAVQRSDPRSCALDELRTRYDPAPSTSTNNGWYGGAPFPPNSETFPDGAANAGSQMYSGGNAGGYTYR